MRRRAPKVITVKFSRPARAAEIGGSDDSDDFDASEDDSRTEPIDYRFTLANERTFLAWIRTSLGLLAGAVAVHTLVEPIGASAALRAAMLVCVALAWVVSIASYRRWRAVDRAMNAGARLPSPGTAPLLAGGLAVVSALVAAAVVLT